MTSNTNQSNNTPNFILKAGKNHLAHTTEEFSQAKQRIPEAYHDFLILLPQNVKLNKTKYTISPDAKELGMYSTDNGTYISIKKPYMTVDGRVQMARDEHHAKEKRLDIGEPTFTTHGDYIIVSVTVVSEIHGTSTGIIELGTSGGVDNSNPFANAQTSAIGRALGFLGYGLVGTAAISADEMNGLSGQGDQQQQSGESDSQQQQPQPLPTSGNKPLDYRVQIVGGFTFNRDKTSTVQALLESRETITLVIPGQHIEFAKSIKDGDVILLKGWLKEDRLRVANQQPVLDSKQAV